MYVGRIVAVGMTKSGRLSAMYRVSSRSFPNRQTRMIGSSIAIVPKQGFETDVYTNPYIAYTCLRVSGEYAVVGNGTHVDPVIEKLDTGMRMRDAIVSVLYGMDYEHDQLDTPRIVAVVNKHKRQCLVGIIRRDALLVQEMPVSAGQACYIATYEHTAPHERYRDEQFDATSAEDACAYILGKGVFATLDRPISAACALETYDGFTIGYIDAGHAGGASEPASAG